MAKTPNDSPDELKQEHTEIYAEILKIMNGRRSVDELEDKGALSRDLRMLIALASAIATERDRDTIVSCVTDCLKAGASREQIMEVLRLAILMAEVPAESYDMFVREAIDSFERQD